MGSKRKQAECEGQGGYINSDGVEGDKDDKDNKKILVQFQEVEAVSKLGYWSRGTLIYISCIHDLC